MKTLLVLLVAVLLLGNIAADFPPELPSSFYGTVTNARVGQTVNVYVNGVLTAWTQTLLYNGNVVYSADVVMNGVPAGTIAVFKIKNTVYGTAPLHSGTNVNLNLAPQTKRSLLRK